MKHYENTLRDLLLDRNFRHGDGDYRSILPAGRGGSRRPYDILESLAHCR